MMKRIIGIIVVVSVFTMAAGCRTSDNSDSSIPSGSFPIPVAEETASSAIPSTEPRIIDSSISLPAKEETSVEIILTTEPEMTVDSSEQSPSGDVTRECLFTASSNDNLLQYINDGDVLTVWKPVSQADQFLEISMEGVAPVQGIYIQWAVIPSSWHFFVMDSNGIWSELPVDRYFNMLNAYIQLPVNCRAVELAADNDKDQFIIGEINVYTEGKLPGQVQIWHQPESKIDLMVVSCHPDDEFLFLGGTLPYYAGQLNKKTVVIYMTFGKEERKREALNGLWAVGVTSYPVFGDFVDKKTLSLEAAKEIWDEDEVINYLVIQIRRFNPAVIVSQDLNGEYGHGAHSLTAEALLKAINASEDAYAYPESAKTYGTWVVGKCYLHLYNKNMIDMNWQQPLDKFDGKTALDMAKLGYSFDLSQLQYGREVSDRGIYDCSKFGLAYTSVGYDVKKDDFFENIG